MALSLSHCVCLSFFHPLCLCQSASLSLTVFCLYFSWLFPCLSVFVPLSFTHPVSLSVCLCLYLSSVSLFLMALSLSSHSPYLLCICFSHLSLSLSLFFSLSSSPSPPLPLPPSFSPCSLSREITIANHCCLFVLQIFVSRQQNELSVFSWTRKSCNKGIRTLDNQTTVLNPSHPKYTLLLLCMPTYSIRVYRLTRSVQSSKSTVR